MPYRSIDLGNAGVLAPGRWRWLRALLWMLLLFAVASFLGYPGWIRRLVVMPLWARSLVWLAGAAVAYLAYAGLVRAGERRRASEIELAALPGDLMIGILIGVGMFTLVFASLRLAGVYTLAPGSWDDWGADIAKTLATGLREELLIRLVLFRLIMRAFGLWPALLASAALFGAAHLANPDATWMAAAAIAVEAGLMLAAFYVLTGRIWMSVGVHAAWNFTQGSIFGASVSGQVEKGSLFVSAPIASAPTWLSGGKFGPEASLSAVIVGLAVFLVVMRRALRQPD